MAAYIDRGDIRFIFHHRIVLGQESQWAAEAAECAADQGYFWAYHSKLMSSQQGVGRGTFSKANLKRFATQLGLDSKSFNSCLDSGARRGVVERFDQQAAALKIDGTPSFLLNDKLVRGLPPVDQLLQLIDQELKQP